MFRTDKLNIKTASSFYVCPKAYVIRRVVKFAFVDDAEELNYLNGKEFSLQSVWFAEEFKGKKR